MSTVDCLVVDPFVRDGRAWRYVRASRSHAHRRARPHRALAPLVALPARHAPWTSARRRHFCELRVPSGRRCGHTERSINLCCPACGPGGHRVAGAPDAATAIARARDTLNRRLRERERVKETRYANVPGFTPLVLTIGGAMAPKFAAHWEYWRHTYAHASSLVRELSVLLIRERAGRYRF